MGEVVHAGGMRGILPGSADVPNRPEGFAGLGLRQGARDASFINELLQS
jgi:hypothetical protein